MITWISKKQVFKNGKKFYKAGDEIPAELLTEARLESFKKKKLVKVTEEIKPEPEKVKPEKVAKPKPVIKEPEPVIKKSTVEESKPFIDESTFGDANRPLIPAIESQEDDND